MGSMSIWHWILVLGVALLLFGGRGKISELMGDFAKGIKSFKKGLSEEEKTEEAAKPDQMKTIDSQSPPTGAPVADGAPAGAPAWRRGVTRNVQHRLERAAHHRHRRVGCDRAEGVARCAAHAGAMDDESQAHGVGIPKPVPRGHARS